MRSSASMRNASLVFVLICSLQVVAQELPSVSGSYQKASLTEVLTSLESQVGSVRFYYDINTLDSILYSGSFQDVALDKALSLIFKASQTHFFVRENKVFVTGQMKIVTDLPISYSQRAEAKRPTMQKGLIFKRDYLSRAKGRELETRVVEIGNRNEQAKGLAIVSGQITSEEDQQPLVGVTVFSQSGESSISDAKGIYSLRLPRGKHLLSVQYVGMKTTKRSIVVFSDGRLDIELEIDLVALQEVTVVANRDENVEEVQMGVSKIDIEKIKNVPVLLGEKDILKVATTLAGVQTVGEGAAGFNVRGGKSDQNMILLDGATVYNASHFFGFFSVFNSDALDNLNVYAASIPASQGGRLSSVFDIESKAASQQQVNGFGGVSFITSKLGIEIPIIKEEAGLMVAARTTYSDWLLRNVEDTEFRSNEVNFGDLILRYDHAVNEKNSITLSGYYSKDKFNLSSDTLFSFSNFSYDNIIGSVKWNHQFNDKLQGHLNTTYSEYTYDLSFDSSPPNAFTQDFGIRESNVSGLIDYLPNERHNFKAGFATKWYRVNPGTKNPLGEASVVLPLNIEQEQAVESALHLSDEYQVTPTLAIYAGLRYSLFSTYGEKTVTIYEEGLPRNSDAAIATETFEKGEVIETYQGPELRLSVRNKLSEFASVKASYNKTRQYVHTLTNSASVSPTDIWRLSGRYLLPQIADQLSLGYFHNFLDGELEFSASAYYKNIQNLLDFKIGADFLLNERVETATLQGPGKSYGLELSAAKSGRLNGWINYTFARTFLKLEGDFPEETINNGRFYPANYDIPHSLNLVTNYKLTKRWSFSYNLKYNSGRPTSYPVATYNFRGTQSILFRDRNEDRIPFYLRMDLGINLEAGHKLEKLTRSYWTLSIYNMLGRRNVYSVFFDITEDQVTGYELLVFDRPIPTLTYNFKF